VLSPSGKTGVASRLVAEPTEKEKRKAGNSSAGEVGREEVGLDGVHPLHSADNS